MLEAAQRERAAGVDVVVGYVEPHGRPETEALLAGLESISARPIPYRGVTLREFDLDAALAQAAAAIARRRTGPHQRRRIAACKALAGCRGIAASRHQRMDDAECPAR